MGTKKENGKKISNFKALNNFHYLFYMYFCVRIRKINFGYPLVDGWGNAAIDLDAGSYHYTRSLSHPDILSLPVVLQLS